MTRHPEPRLWITYSRRSSTRARQKIRPSIAGRLCPTISTPHSRTAPLQSAWQSLQCAACVEPPAEFDSYGLAIGRPTRFPIS
jgi:hypothetical protein